MRTHRSRASRLLLSLVLLGAACLVAAPAAWAGGSMPNVVNKTEEHAVRELEALGLRVRIVTQSGVTAGRVAWQSPVPGTAVDDGDEVELRVGVTLNIPTVAPRVIGMTEAEASEALDEAYVLEIEHVSGARALEGRVSGQDPAPGATVPLRSLFRLRVVRNQAEVPVLVGRMLDEAAQALRDAGLTMHVRYVDTRAAPQDTVVGQVPAAGASLLPGGDVEVLVAGREPGGASPDENVRVPDLVGLGMHAAEEEVLALGLTPHVHLVDRPGQPAWSVVAQEVPAGSLARQGAAVGFDVVRPDDLASGVRAPSLYGLSRDEALALLGHLGLRAVLREAASTLPAGTVVEQAPAPGVLMGSGSTMQLTLARAAPHDWTPPQVEVPDVRGVRASDAFLRILAAGLRPNLRREQAADRPVDLVHRQEPHPGARVLLGTRVTYYVPFRASMPALLGKTITQALQDLTDAGLQGEGQRLGPPMPGWISEVTWQPHPAGTVLARGSRVVVRYRMKAPPTPLRSVPNVVGMTREAAAARLQASGFHANLRAISIGVGTTQVVSQSPVAGALRPAGHTVEVSYRFVGPVLPPIVVVPRVLGMSRGAAEHALTNQGFRVSSVRQGPGGPAVMPTEVIAQSPLPGTPLARGATVTITYRLRAAVGVMVRVPDVTGRTLNQAIDALRAVGLGHTTTHVGLRVRSQSPAAGTLVAPGSSVRLRLGF